MALKLAKITSVFFLAQAHGRIATRPAPVIYHAAKSDDEIIKFNLHVYDWMHAQDFFVYPIYGLFSRLPRIH